MAQYVTTIESTRTPSEAFDYLAEFSRAAEWDPNVKEGSRLTSGPVGHGSSFRIVSSFLGRSVPLQYQVTAFEPARRVVLEADNFAVLSVDEITVEPSRTGSRVSYHADLRLKGILRLADPLLALAFRRLGDRATSGLRRELNR
jgi:hypothetical protein